MERFIIKLKDHSKRNFFLELLAQLDFIEFTLGEEATQKLESEEEYDFFKSAGLFVNRNIDANQLRRQAWRMTN